MNQSRNGTSRMLLPAGFVTVHDILDNQVQPRSRVSIVGVVTDFRVPVPTRGAGIYFSKTMLNQVLTRRFFKTGSVKSDSMIILLKMIPSRSS